MVGFPERASEPLHTLFPLPGILYFPLSPITCLTPTYASEPSSHDPSIRPFLQATLSLPVIRFLSWFQPLLCSTCYHCTSVVNWVIVV